MTLRLSLTTATLTLLAACGPTGDRPWDQNHDGLITACEGLNPTACDATPGCERGTAFCTMICRDDGRGGCLPCPESDVCRPVAPVPPAPPPTFDCAQVPPVICQMVAGCELETLTVCSGSVGPSDPSVPPMPRCGNDECHEVVSCVNARPAQRCEDLDVSVCLSKPGCGIETSGAVCDIACVAGQPCPPCATPSERCVTLPPVGACETRDESTCTLDGQCQLEATTCLYDCAPNSPCPPCPAPAIRCVPVVPADDCASRDPNVCALDGRCVIAAGGVCPAVCELDADGGCKPCPAPFAVCVPAPTVVDGGIVPPPVTDAGTPSRCADLDPATCEAAGCVLYELGISCTAQCLDDSDGGCLPCQDYVCAER